MLTELYFCIKKVFPITGTFSLLKKPSFTKKVLIDKETSGYEIMWKNPKESGNDR